MVMKMSNEGIAYDFAIRLKEMMLVIKYSIDKENVNDIETKHEKILFFLHDFNLLVKAIVENGDTESLEEALNELDLFIESDRTLLRDYEFKRSIPEDEKKIYSNRSDLTEELYIRNKKLFNWCRGVAFGNYSWIFYKKLYKSGKEALEEKSLVLLEKFSYFDSHFFEFISEILKTDYNFFNWEDWIWNIEKRLNGEAYTLPSREDVIFFGTTAFFLRNIHFQPTIEQSSVKFVEYFLLRSREFLRIINENSGFWYQSLKCQTKEELHDRIDALIKYYDSIQLRKDQLFFTRLASTKISEQKKEVFIEGMVNQWRNSQNLTKVFEYFNSVSTNPDFELQRVGISVNFKKAKIMFVDTEQYSPIYNIDWGKDINRNKEELLGRRLLEAHLNEQKGNEFVKELDLAIAELNKKHPANIILSTASSFFRYEQDLINSGNYLPVWQDKQEKFPFKYLGIYRDNIPVVKVFSRIFPDRVIVLSLPSSILLFEREKKEWIDNRLQIKVDEISQEKALEIYEKNLLEYSSDSREDALNIIKSGIIIDIDEICDFVISKEVTRVINISGK